MLKISGPVGAAVFVAAVLLSGAIVVFSIESARADDSAHAADGARAADCLAAPTKTAAPAGKHWYYRVDRASQRKCWYLRGTVPGVQVQHRPIFEHRAVAAASENTTAAPEPQIEATPSAAPTPQPPAAVSPTGRAPMPDDTAGSVPPAPHITVLAVRPSTPFVSTTGVPQRNTPEEAPAPTAPQTLPHDEGTPAIDAAKPKADANAAETQSKADAAYNAPAQTANAVPIAAKARTAEMFLLVALVLGIAAALIATVSKIVGIYRRPKIFVDPDASWIDYRSAAEQRTDAEAGCDGHGVPFLDPQEHYGLADLQTQEWLDRSAPARDESSPLPTRNEDFTQRRSPQPSEADIALAIQVLRQARQSRVA